MGITISDIKEKVIAAIQRLPENADYDDIMEVVYLQQKIARGLKQIDEGQYITHEQFEKQINDRKKNRKKV